jgi:hypothetical protein
LGEASVPDETATYTPQPAFQAIADPAAAARIFRTHESWTNRPARAALYVARDPRDVAVTFAAYQHRTLDEVIDQMNFDGHYIGPSSGQPGPRIEAWSSHVNSWLDHGHMPVHLIRYEDLLRDTAGELVRAMAFLGAEGLEEQNVARAVRYADFAELRRQEQARGFHQRTRVQEIGTRDVSSLARGRAGDWRQYLSVRQVRRLENAHAATMLRLGYELVTNRESAA